MISPELLRRYPFFAGLTHKQIVTLANAAEDRTVEEGHYFFHDGDPLDYFFLNVEGAAAIVVELPDADVEQSIAGQLTGDIKTRDVIISTIGPGDVFGWSGLVPPNESTASAKALTRCRVIAFDCIALRKVFEENCDLGYQLMRKAAQVIRSRLRDLRIESLAAHVS